MAADSCGGSTPFKRLVDLGVQDRSLQQDRINRTSNAQNVFRSDATSRSPDPASFGDFITGGTGLHSVPSNYYSLSTEQSKPTQAGRGHATDQWGLHHLTYGLQSNALNPAPLMFVGPGNRQSVQPLVTPGAVSSAATWAQDFDRFSGGLAGSNQTFRPNPVSTHQAPPVGLPQSFLASHWDRAPQLSVPLRTPLIGGFANPITVAAQEDTHAEADFDLEMSLWMANHGDSHIEDVDAIMEELAQELDEGRRAGLPQLLPTRGPNIVISTSNTSLNSDTMDSATTTKNNADSASAARLAVFEDQSSVADVAGVYTTAVEVSTKGRHSPIPSLRGPPISDLSATVEPAPDPTLSGLDLTETDRMDSAGVDGEQRSGVSEAARQLLKSVEHEQGDKWKQSKFLSLMRDFRDGKKDVVKNELRETVGS